MLVSIVSAKQASYLQNIGNTTTEAIASGSSLAFTIGLILGVGNVVLAFL